MASDATEREHDVVVFGATGFRPRAAWRCPSTSRGRHRRGCGSHWRRPLDKLERTREALGEGAVEWPLVVADSGEDEAMASLAGSTRVVATTVGPYMRYGMPLVAACAAAGTHYADLTGEVLFMRRSIDEHDATARASGARIVHTWRASIRSPPDLGVLALHAHAREHDLGDLGDTTLVVVATRGGISGGTIDSMRGQLDEARRDPAARRLMVDPYALSPERGDEPDLGPERDPMSVVHDPALGGYLAPFVMATINTRVVRRSNALQGHAYGRRLRYRELMLTGGLPLGPVKAAAIAGGLGALVGGLSFTPTRKLLDRLLPDPGEGPGEEAREKGFRIDTHAQTSDGARIVAEIRASGDPGDKATAVMARAPSRSRPTQTASPTAPACSPPPPRSAKRSPNACGTPDRPTACATMLERRHGE